MKSALLLFYIRVVTLETPFAAEVACGWATVFSAEKQLRFRSELLTF